MLNKYTVGHLKPTAKKPLISIKHTDTVEHAFQLMQKHKISALPVYRTILAEDDTLMQHEYLAIITSLDLLQFVAMKETSESIDQLRLMTAWQVEHVLSERFQYLTEHVMQVINQMPHMRTSIVWFDLTQPLFNLAFAMSRHELHQVLVRPGDDDDSSVSIVTQTDLIEFCHDHFSELVPHGDYLASDLVGSLLAEQSRMCVVMDSVHALTAFKKMSIHSVYSIAVIDSQGRLCAELNASDVKLVHVDRMHMLQLPVLLFLESLQNEHGRSMEPVIAHLAPLRQPPLLDRVRRAR